MKIKKKMKKKMGGGGGGGKHFREDYHVIVNIFCVFE